MTCAVFPKSRPSPISRLSWNKLRSRTMKIYAGIDIGSCTTKTVVIDEQGSVLGSDVRRSGIDYSTVARESIETALAGKNIEGVPIVSTGYGRHNIAFAMQAKTEIACHAKGAYFYCP